jgi:hypothetical protein
MPREPRLESIKPATFAHVCFGAHNGLESDIAQGVPSTDLPPSKSSVRFEQEATWHRIYEWKEAAN